LEKFLIGFSTDLEKSQLIWKFSTEWENLNDLESQRFGKISTDLEKSQLNGKFSMIWNLN